MGPACSWFAFSYLLAVMDVAYAFYSDYIPRSRIGLIVVMAGVYFC